MVMKMMKFRLGFSLFETFVVMAIVGIFIALMANTVAHRPKAKLASEAHGRFECYYDESGQLWQQLFTEGSSQGKKLAKNNGGTETTCSFQPPYYAKYMIIDAVKTLDEAKEKWLDVINNDSLFESLEGEEREDAINETRLIADSDPWGQRDWEDRITIYVTTEKLEV